MACYNAREWISETLESTRQPYPWPVEVIVVDDGSTDDSATLIGRDFPEVHLVQTPNRGCSAARSLGTQIARGRFLKYLDSDDILEAGVVQRQVQLIEDSKADVVYGDWQRLVLEEGHWRRGKTIHRTWKTVHSDPEIAFFTSMWCPTAAYLWDLNFIRQQHPGWHPNLPVIQDARFALDAAVAGANWTHDPEIGVLYRTHSTGSVGTCHPTKFNRDCLLNAEETALRWQNTNSLNQERLQAILTVFEYIALEIYPHDRSLAYRAVCFAKNLQPGWYPKQTKLRAVVGRLFGFTAVANLRQIMHGYRAAG